MTTSANPSSDAAAILSGAPQGTNITAADLPANMQPNEANAARNDAAAQAAMSPQIPATGANTAALNQLGPQHPSVSPAAPQIQPHHGVLGKLAEALFSGKTTEYQTDPKTGQVVPVEVKQKPGQIFRNILGGALMGMAAGSGGADSEGRRVSTDFGSGIGRGAAAALQQRQAQDQQAYQRAQDQAKNQREAQSATDLHLKRQSAMAHSDLQDYQLAANMDLHSPAQIAAANENYSARLQKADEAGAIPASIVIDGKEWNDTPGNADNFHAAYTNNPKAFQPPQGYEAIKGLSVDTPGLHYDQHRDPQTGQVISRWLDQDGNPVDMDSRTTITYRWVPVDQWDQVKSHSGAEINALAGEQVVDPDKTYNLSLGELSQVSRNGIERLNADTRARNSQRTPNPRTPTARRTTSSSDPRVDAAVDKILSSNASPEDQVKALENTNLSPAQKIAGRKLLKSLGPKAPNVKPTAPVIKPPQPGAVITMDAVHAYLAANDNDPAKAREAARKDGWALPGPR